MKFYAGIGSRETPPDVQQQMSHLAQELEKLGYVLRTGDARSADKAFRDAASNAQVWTANPRCKDPRACYLAEDDAAAYLSVKMLHPGYGKLDEYSLRLHARNYRQIIGKDEPNSQFVICWTQGGKAIGGTAQAIRVACMHKIPIFNLYDPTMYQNVLSKIQLETIFGDET